MASFTTDSTIHGVSFIFGPNRSIFVRIIWICLFVLSIYGLVYYIRGSYIKWLIEPEIITRSQTKQMSDVQDIAVTICPQIFEINHFGFFEKFHKLQSEEVKPSREDCLAFGAYNSWCQNQNITQTKYEDSKLKWSWIGDVDCLDPYGTFKFDLPTWTELASILSTANNKLILDNYFHGFEKGSHASKPSENFFNVFTSFGLCTTYNMLKKSIFKEKWMNEAHGLIKDGELESNWTSDTENYKTEQVVLSHLIFSKATASFTKISCNRNSYKVIIHQPNEIPTRFHESFDFEHGKATKIKVNIKSERTSENMRILDPNIRKCLFEDEGNLKYFRRYSEYHCLIECQENTTSCNSLEIPRANATKRGFCGLSWKKLDKNEEQAARNCNCLPNCNRFSYRVSKVEEKENMVLSGVLVIKEEEVEEIERLITYTLANFVADIGGFLGLFLGCSLLSIVEVFFFLFAKIFNLLKKNRGETFPLADLEQAMDALIEKKMRSEMTNLNRKVTILNVEVRELHERLASQTTNNAEVKRGGNNFQAATFSKNALHFPGNLNSGPFELTVEDIE